MRSIFSAILPNRFFTRLSANAQSIVGATLLPASCALLLLCILAAGCRNGDTRKAGLSPEASAALSAFQAGLDAALKSGNDSVISPAVRHLYAAAFPEIHDTIFPAVHEAQKAILLFHTQVDTAILPFYIGLSEDSSLAPRHRAKAALSLANYHAHVRQNADSAQHYLERAGLYRHYLDDTLRYRLTSIEAQVFQLRGQLKEATASLYQCIAWSEKINDTLQIARDYGSLANVYRSMGDGREAVACRKKALAAFSAKGDKGGMANCYGGIGADFTDLGALDSAQPYLLAAEALYDQGIINPVPQYFLYLTQGTRYARLDKYDSAVRSYDKARPILAQFNDPAQEAVFAASSVESYAHFRNVDAEVALVEASIPDALAAGNLQVARDACIVLYQVSLSRPDRDRSLEYYQQYDSLTAVLSDQANREYVAEMETKYETEKKALQIQLQQKEIKRKSQLNTILALSLAAAALLATGIITRMKLRRSRREAGQQVLFTQRLLLQTEEERSRIAAELHDSISHELLALKNSLHQTGTEPGLRIDGIINDIRRISRNLHPVMLDKIGLEASIHHLCEQLTESGAIFATAEVALPRRLSYDMELQLFRMVQESLSNAAKHAGAHAAKVDLTEHNGIVSLTVLDNGTGFDVSEKLASKDSFGLHTLLERGKAIGGKTTITSAGQGTAIHLQAPASYAKAAHHYYRG